MAKAPIIFMFSGQGSHYYHMGAELFASQPVFRQTLENLDQQVQALLGCSVLARLYDGQCKKADLFATTRYTHPAIFMVEYALAQTLLAQGIKPDYVLGASLGSFIAATLAGALSVEQALQAVIKQAELVEDHCPPGTMVAILADPTLYNQQPALADYSTLAAVNFNQHFVVATDLTGLAPIEDWLGQQISYQRLAVSHAFHSHWLDPVKADYTTFLTSQPLTTLHIPFVCCAEAKVLSQLTNDYFWQVIRQPICFQQSIRWLESQGTYQYIDLGPSGTLATFVKYNLAPGSTSTSHAIITPYGGEQAKLDALISDIH